MKQSFVGSLAKRAVARALRLVFEIRRRSVRWLRWQTAQRHQRSGRLSMGRYVYGNPHIASYAGPNGRVEIGSFCMLAEDVEILTGGNHHAEWVTMFPLREQLAGGKEGEHLTTRGDIVIGSDVYIGPGTKILSGIRIGDGSVIGANTMVTKDIPPYTVVAGNPARELRLRFSEEQVRALLGIRWWDWPIEEIMALTDLLESPDIDRFVEAGERVSARLRDGGDRRA